MLCLYVDVVSQFQAHTCTCIHRHTYTHTCTHTYTYTYIDTYTYIHTHAQKRIVDMVSLFQAHTPTYIHHKSMLPIFSQTSRFYDPVYDCTIAMVNLRFLHSPTILLTWCMSR